VAGGASKDDRKNPKCEMKNISIDISETGDVKATFIGDGVFHTAWYSRFAIGDAIIKFIETGKVNSIPANTSESWKTPSD
jgi:hypothetical protein